MQLILTLHEDRQRRQERGKPTAVRAILQSDNCISERSRLQSALGTVSLEVGAKRLGFTTRVRCRHSGLASTERRVLDSGN